MAAVRFATDLTARGVTWHIDGDHLVYEGPHAEIVRLRTEAWWPAVQHRLALYRMVRVIERTSGALPS